MYVVTKIGHNFYAINYDDYYEAFEYAVGRAESGDPVLLTENLDEYYIHAFNDVGLEDIEELEPAD